MKWKKTYLSDFYLEIKYKMESGKQGVLLINSDLFLSELYHILVFKNNYSFRKYLETIFTLYENCTFKLENREFCYFMHIYKKSTAPKLNTLSDYKKFYEEIRNFIMTKEEEIEELPF